MGDNNLANHILIANNAGRLSALRISALMPGLGYSLPLTETRMEDFNNGEIFIQLKENQRRRQLHVFLQMRDPEADNLIAKVKEFDLPTEEKLHLIQLIHGPNDDFMGGLIFGDAIKRAGCDEICLYAPFLPYMRQDKKDEGRVPITAKLVFDLIERAYGKKLDRIITAHLHAAQEQGFFDGPVDQVLPEPLFASIIRDHYKDLSEVVLVAPDAGGTRLVKSLADVLHVGHAHIDKTRTGHGHSKHGSLVGDVEGKHPVVIDDTLDTGGTIAQSPEIFEKHGARPPYLAIATHGLMSPKITKDKKSIIYAEDVLRRSGMKVIVTDTIRRSDLYLRSNADWLEQWSILPFFADNIMCNLEGRSASGLIKRYRDQAAEGTFPLDRFRLI